MKKPLDGARVSHEVASWLSRPLAAANHRQWAEWEQWVLRRPELLTPENVSQIIADARASGLDASLERCARLTVSIVEGGIRGFAFKPEIAGVVARKLEQFTEWVKHAASNAGEEENLERWLLQCRTPFLRLPSRMQVSDYAEAKRDLEVIARLGGLVLPAQFEVVPQSDFQLRRTRRRHRLGSHGIYPVSEQPWSMVCTGCHNSWSSVP
jgi:hypothetical protein